MSMLEQYHEDPDYSASLPKAPEKTLREQGRENRDAFMENLNKRYDGAKESLSKGWESARGAVSKGWNILKRVGGAASEIAFIDLGDAAKKGGKAAAEYGQQDWQKTKEDYKYIKEGVREKAVKAGEKCSEAWGRVVEAKNKACEWGKQRMDAVCTLGDKIRQGMADRIDDLAAQKYVREEMAKMAKTVRETKRELAPLEREVGRADSKILRTSEKVNDDSEILDMLQDRISRNQAAISEQKMESDGSVDADKKMLATLKERIALKEKVESDQSLAIRLQDRIDKNNQMIENLKAYRDQRALGYRGSDNLREHLDLISQKKVKPANGQEAPAN